MPLKFPPGQRFPGQRLAFFTPRNSASAIDTDTPTQHFIYARGEAPSVVGLISSIFKNLPTVLIIVPKFITISSQLYVDSRGSWITFAAMSTDGVFPVIPFDTGYLLILGVGR